MASAKNGPPKPELPGGPPTEQSRRILELNRVGNSTRQISRITKTPRTTVQRILDRLSQDPNNCVKDNSRNAVEDGKWFKIISHIRDSVLPFYQKELDIRPSLREVLYYL